MKEVNINSYLVASLRELGYHTHKIPDNMGMAARFSPDKPYDIFSVNEVTMGVETKLVKPKGKSNFSSFRFNMFEHQQLPWLYDINRRSHGVGIVALCIWKPRSIHRMYLFNVMEILKRMNEGKTSLLGKEIEQLTNFWECKKNIYQFPTNLEEIMTAKKLELQNEINEETDRSIQSILEQFTGE